MGKEKRRYVARATAGIGWRIWDHKAARWWGKPFGYHPEELIAELNGPKRPEKVVELSKPRKG